MIAMASARRSQTRTSRWIKQDSKDLRAALAVQAREHREAARGNYYDMVCLIAAMGHDGRKYRREATQRF